MKKIISIALLIFFNTSIVFGQTPNYYDYQTYTGVLGGGTIVFNGENPSEACLTGFTDHIAPVFANSPTVKAVYTGFEAFSPGGISSTRWRCSYDQVLESTGQVVAEGLIDVFGQCQDASRLSPRPEPLFNGQSPSFSRSLERCACSSPYVFNESTQWCAARIPNKERGCEGNLPNYGPNPCNIATGNKLRVEMDIENGSLSFTRYYNSIGINENTGMGLKWTHNYQRSLTFDNAVANFGEIILDSSSGRSEVFTRIAGSNNWEPESDSDYQLRSEGLAYIITLPNGAEESYSIGNGEIMSHTDTNGQTTTYEYQRLDTWNTFQYLMSVTNEYGHSLQFEYERVPEFEGTPNPHHRINKITDAFGAVYQYQYDENRNLTTVIYPDTTPSDDTDNPRKIYHYDNQDYPNHLTGITDENGERYGNFAYDDDGKAILSELGTTTNVVGQEKIELDFQ